MEPVRRYFAYGYNLDRVHMRSQCPAAVPTCIVTLPDWQFRIAAHGYATIVPHAGSRVIGQVWHLSAACERALDAFERVADGYYRKAKVIAGAAPALVYLAGGDSTGAPVPGYVEGIVTVATGLGFDRDYVAEIAGWMSAPG